MLRNGFRIFFLYLMFVQVAYAYPFTIEPYVTLPKTVRTGGTADALYRVMNNTGVDRKGNFVKWLPPNTRILPGGCGSEFDLAAGGSCLLRLRIIGPIDASDKSTRNHLFVCMMGGKACAGTAHPLNITLSDDKPQQFSYTANQTGNTVSICHANHDNFTDCITQRDDTFSEPSDVILNQSASMAYVANVRSGKISMCNVSSQDGTLNTCQLSDVVYAPDGYPGIQINKGYLYATDYWANLVYICPIQLNGSLGACASSSGAETFIAPNGRVTFNPKGSKIYVANYWSSAAISTCDVNGDGSLSDCTHATGANFLYSLGAYMNPMGNYLYVPHLYNTIEVCPIQADGSLKACTPVTDPSFQLGDYELNLFISADQYLYVPNPRGDLSGTTLSICPIEPNGLFDACAVNEGDGTFAGITSAWTAHQ